MRNRSLRSSFALFGVVLLVLAQAGLVHGEKQKQDTESTVQAIVEFESSVKDVRAKTERLVSQLNGQQSHIYTNIMRGSAITLPVNKVDTLKEQPGIAQVQLNQERVLRKKSFFVQNDKDAKAVDASTDILPYQTIGSFDRKTDLASTLARIDLITSKAKKNQNTSYASVLSFRVSSESQALSLLQSSLEKSASSAGVSNLSTVGQTPMNLEGSLSTARAVPYGQTYYQDYWEIISEWGYDGLQFVGGFALGVGKYASSSLHNIVKMGKKMSNPGKFFSQIHQGIEEMIAIVNKEGGVAFLKVLLPLSVYHKLRNWSRLSSFERGVVSGHLVGTVGVEIAFAYYGIGKLLESLSVRAGTIGARLSLILELLRRIQTMDTPPQLRRPNTEKFLTELFKPKSFQPRMIDTVLKRFSYDRRDAFKAIYAKTVDKLDQKGITRKGDKFGKNYPLTVNVIGHEVFVTGKVLKHGQVEIHKVWHKSATSPRSLSASIMPLK